MRKTYTKPFYTITKQIEVLLQRGLVFDPDKIGVLKDALRLIGFTRFNLYSSPYYDPEEPVKCYVEGTSVERIVNDYKADDAIKLLTFEAARAIEIAFRAAIVNALGEKYGPFPYDEEDYYNRADYNWKKMVPYINKANTAAKRDYITANFRRKYFYVFFPIWIIAEFLRFGTLVKFYQIQKESIQKSIAYEFKVSYTVLRSWIHTVSGLRNISAHHNRILGASLNIDPLIPKNVAYEKYRALFEVAKPKTYFLDMLESLGIKEIQEKFLKGVEDIVEKYDVNRDILGLPDCNVSSILL